MLLIFSSLAGAVAKYCDNYVSVFVFVCPRVREDISGTTLVIFTIFLCILPMAVAGSSSGRVAKSQGKGQFWGVPP